MKTSNRFASRTLMNLRLVCGAVAVVALLSTTLAPAQDAPKPQEPEYTNSFYYLDSTGALKPLDRQPVGVNAKTMQLREFCVGHDFSRAEKA